MSSELRLKKLRGSGGYIMASIDDEQQTKGNLGGPDLFLAPIGRLDEQKISKHFCNICEKELEGPPKIQYENPNELVAENLILAEKGQYMCITCDGIIAEYRNFKKQDETEDIGNAKPLEPETQAETVPATPQAEQQNVEDVTKPMESVSSIEGLSVFDENANMIGKAKQVGVDSSQAVVLIITKNDGIDASIPWNKIKKIGQIILLGNPDSVQSQPGKCPKCGFINKENSKFCEECGSKITSQ